MRVIASIFSSRFVSISMAVIASGALTVNSGCGRSKTASIPPPPQTLSEPVRLVDSASPTLPGDPTLSPLAAGESKPLPSLSAPPPSYTPAPVSNGGSRYHTLAKGETLYGVARTYGVKPKMLIDANNFKDPNRLAVGTKVMIP